MANHLVKGSFATLCRCARLHQSSLLRHMSPATTSRAQSTDSAAKEYPVHIRGIVDDISKLNLLEVADLNELLKSTLNISDAPMMAMGAMPIAAAAEEEEVAAVPTGPSLYSVKLVKFDDKKKVPLIKEIKNLMTGMNLVQAKKFVESAPTEVRKDMTKEEAETLQHALEAVGGSVSVDEQI